MPLPTESPTECLSRPSPNVFCATDEAEAPRLPADGQGESPAGRALPPPHLPAHQEEAAVRRKRASSQHPPLGGEEQSVTQHAVCRLFQRGHGGVDGHRGGAAVQESGGVSVDGAVPGGTGGSRDHQVCAPSINQSIKQHWRSLKRQLLRNNT